MRAAVVVGVVAGALALAGCEGAQVTAPNASPNPATLEFMSDVRAIEGGAWVIPLAVDSDGTALVIAKRPDWPLGITGSHLSLELHARDGSVDVLDSRAEGVGPWAAMNDQIVGWETEAGWIVLDRSSGTRTTHAGPISSGVTGDNLDAWDLTAAGDTLVLITNDSQDQDYRTLAIAMSADGTTDAVGIEGLQASVATDLCVARAGDGVVAVTTQVFDNSGGVDGVLLSSFFAVQGGLIDELPALQKSSPLVGPRMFGTAACNGRTFGLARDGGSDPTRGLLLEQVGDDGSPASLVAEMPFAHHSQDAVATATYFASSVSLDGLVVHDFASGHTHTVRFGGGQCGGPKFADGWVLWNEPTTVVEPQTAGDLFANDIDPEVYFSCSTFVGRVALP